jgi:hypothetical protein
MTDIVKLDEVQSWLESTKLRLSGLDYELTDTAKTMVFAKLAGTYDTTTWTDYTTTPTLVRKVIAMYVASWTYSRQYSEAVSMSQNDYALWLERKADQMLDGILTGGYTLEVEATGGNPGSPGYWPNDTTGSTQPTDAAGNAIGGQYSEDIKFTMGQVF